MSKKLTSSQKDALESLLCDGPVDNAGALVRFGSAWRRTLLSLVERGFARHFPTARASDGSRSGVWRITPDGRDEVVEIEAMAEFNLRHKPVKGELVLNVKVGTWSLQRLAAPRLSEPPKVGDRFELREGLGRLEMVRLTEVRPYGDDFVYFVERV
jgi:hypothetical protein